MLANIGNQLYFRDCIECIVGSEANNSQVFCFSFGQVSPDLMSKFNFVAGMVPILQAYIAEVGVGNH